MAGQQWLRASWKLNGKANGDKLLRERFKDIAASIKPVNKKVISRETASLQQQVQTYHRLNFQTHTGHTYNSIRQRTTDTPAGPIGVVETDKKWSPIQEYGGTIVPKKAKSLAIPIGPEARNIGLLGGGGAMTGAGVSRGGPRDYPKGELFRGPKGSALRSDILWKAKGKTGVVPMFLLRRSVRIPARPVWRPSLKIRRPFIVKALGRAMRAVLKG